MAKVAKNPPQIKALPAKVKKTAQAVAKPVQKATTKKVPAVESSSPAATETPRDEMVICRAAERKGEPVLLEKWRYDLLRQAILNVVPADDIGLMYKQLTPAVRANLSREDRKRMGQLHHDTTLVKLDLEFHGELVRIEGMRPQYLRRIVKASQSSPKKKMTNKMTQKPLKPA